MKKSTIFLHTKIPQTNTKKLYRKKTYTSQKQVFYRRQKNTCV